MKRRDCIALGFYLILTGLMIWFIALLPQAGRDAAAEAIVVKLTEKAEWK